MSPANHVTLKMRRGLRFIVLIREDLNVQPVADILQLYYYYYYITITKAAHSSQLF